ncbi:MAG: acetate--CoA ligase family protein, partial [Anaerolineae bacterium]|nr:acetate--CoA ligase family protein [Anaerolineae bacterium]
GVMWRYAEGKEGKEGKEGEGERRFTEMASGKRRPLVGLPSDRTHLGEAEARPVLAAYDIDQPAAGLARTAAEAGQIAEKIGFPVALKIVSPDIFHKSEMGGITLKLGSVDQVHAAFEEMLARVQKRQPEARIEGVLVTQMAPPGHELIVGMRRDPQFGPLLMFGLGGIYVELLKDVAFRVAPFSRAETLAMIGETHAGKLLGGLRGQPPADIDAVAEVIERVARLALDHPQVQEIDINPLIAYETGQGVLAVDVRMVVDPPENAADA